MSTKAGQVQGTEAADPALIQSWALYLRGRAHLADLLEQIWPRMLEIVRGEFRARVRGRAAEVADIQRHTQKKLAVHKSQSDVFLAFRIPSLVKNAQVRIGFLAEDGEARFCIWVAPWEAKARLEDDKPFGKEVRRLEDSGFINRRGQWRRTYTQTDYLGASSVPERLLELATSPVRDIASSGVLSLDIEATVERWKFGGPPRHKKLPKQE